MSVIETGGSVAGNYCPAVQGKGELGGRGTILHRDHKETALRTWIGNLDNS